MKTSNITKSALALALGLCASGAWALTATNAFENFNCAADTAVTNLPTANGFGFAWSAGADAVDYTYAEAATGKLVVDTGSSSVTGALANATAFNNNIANSASFEAKVTFTPATETPSVGGSDLKFALYTKAAAGSTNLFVYADGNEKATGIAVPANVETSVKVTFAANNQFSVFVGSTAASGNPYTFANAGGISQVEFQGNGEVDDLAFTYNAGWNDLLGGPVDGAYEIDNLGELIAFQQGVAEGLETANTTFKLTADIALTAAWPGIGIQNGKDLVDSQEFVDGAFSGIFDGQNYTISNFQMIGKGDNPEGLDYCGFFNSINGATIRNLKIQYAGSLFAEDTTASTKESGATFVGVAMASALQNLTALPKDASTGVSCSKGIGGIVGYLATNSVGRATVVQSCTNNVNLTSLANNKVGGIAMISQRAGCSIINCQNNGTATTTSSEHGGILGYTDTITITDCENTANVKMFYHHGGTVTLSGTNKGYATVASYTGNATPGLNFAIVDGNVATFVADSALAAGNTYKVMATGATATYKFTAAGTIAFDTALATPTWAVTADEGLRLSDATSGTVKTYTAIVPAETYGTTEGTDTAIEIKSGEGSADHTLTSIEATYLNELVQAKGGTAADQADIEAAIAQLTEKEFTDAVLLNQDVTDTTNAGSYEFKVSKISKNSSGVTVTVTLTRDGTPRGGIKGQLVLQTSETPNGTYADAAAADINTENFKFDTGATTATANVVFTGSYKFFKVVIR